MELFALLALVVAGGGIAVRWRLRRMRNPGLGDEEIRQIEEEGRVTTTEPEPLDVDEVRAREEEFWAESWDEPEPL